MNDVAADVHVPLAGDAGFQLFRVNAEGAVVGSGGSSVLGFVKNHQTALQRGFCVRF